MNFVFINGSTYQVTDNSRFLDQDLRTGFNGALDRLCAEYGVIQHPWFKSHVSDDEFRFQVRKHLDKIIGLDGGTGETQHVIVHARLVIGKGKKNAGNNMLYVTCSLCVPSADSDTRSPYKVLDNKFDDYNHLAVSERPVGEQELAGIGDIVVKSVMSAMDAGVRRVRGKWTELNSVKLERDIELMDFAENIKAIFTEQDIKVRVDLENKINCTECSVHDDEGDDSVGSIRMQLYEDGWRIVYANYSFSFVDEVFELVTSSYGKRVTIAEGQVLPLFRTIAGEYARERDVRRKFNAVRGEYVKDTEK